MTKARDPAARRCIGGVSARPCTGGVADGAPLALCDRHLAVASEWIAREHGVVDVLPSPCLACGSRLGVSYPSGWLCATCEWRHGDIPDGELAPPRLDVVYYLRFDDRIKIGTSGNPKQRLGRIWHDEVLGFERGDRLLEQRRHREFADERQGSSEWFTPSERLLAHIAVVAAGVPDPWRAYARWRSEALALRG